MILFLQILQAIAGIRDIVGGAPWTRAENATAKTFPAVASSTAAATTENYYDPGALLGQVMARPASGRELFLPPLSATAQTGAEEIAAPVAAE